ncbi:MAG: thrombospondin type 3 repeat-containing protein [Thermodesulfobacteriota bacterium]
MRTKYCLTFFIIMVLSAVYLPTAHAVTPQIATGAFHNVVLAADGTVWTWGSNASGQLCDSTRPSPDALPRPIPGLTGVTHIAAGSDYTLAVKANGSVWSCGGNLTGQLGRGFISTYEPDIGQVVSESGLGYLTLNAGGTGVMAIAAGLNHSLAIRNDGTVWGWGANAGRLGVDEPARTRCKNDGGPDEVCTKPVPALNITGATAIAAGKLHSMALDAGGQVWTWGSDNNLDQLGRTGDKFIPAIIPGISGATAIAAGWNHALAVSSDGHLYGWGANDTYQVLVSDNYPIRWEPEVPSTTQPIPVFIPTPSYDHNGDIFKANVWDEDTQTWQKMEMPPPLLTNVVSVSASQSQSLIITSDDTGTLPDSVVAWGKNSLKTYVYTDPDTGAEQIRVLSDFRGILGLDNENDYTTSPTDLSLQPALNYLSAAPLWGSNNTVAITSIDVGLEHSLALRADGTVYVSGVNDQYQLADSSIPEFISTPAPVRMIIPPSIITCPSGPDFDFDVDTPPTDCDFDGDGVAYADDNCPSLANPLQTDVAPANGIGDACEDPCLNAGGDSDGDGICRDVDSCPNDPLKSVDPGQCGCNVDETDTDTDGIADCVDSCPNDPNNDIDTDGVCGDVDTCPTDPLKSVDTGQCGCNVDETDTDTDGIADCVDSCPNDQNNDIDTDGVCGDVDTCPTDPLKSVDTGQCGCNVDETDTDTDGIADCEDSCPNDPNNDIDTDGVCGDVDTCPTDPLKSVDTGQCGCNVDETDTDTDGIADCVDSYPNDPNLVSPGISSITPPATDNKNGGNPKVDQKFTFGVTVDAAVEAVGAASVWLFLNDQPIQMACDFSDLAAVQCTSSLRLGPTPEHNYHYEVWDSVDRSGTMLVSSLDIPGPNIYLLNGPNMIGLAKDITASTAGFLDNVGATGVFSWQSAGLRDKYNRGHFVAHDNTHIPTPGEGYFVLGESPDQRLSTSLTTDPAITNLNDPTVTINLQPGWNIIGNPYPAPILLADLRVQKDSGSAITWAEASDINWVFNGIYYFKGSDWGSQYAFESAGSNPDATLTPWLGYWIYVMIDDGATYKLIFSKP